MKSLFRRYDILIVIAFLIVAGCVYSIISLSSHYKFQTFGWDLGFFDQIIWKVSTGDFAAFSTIAKENLLADHFQPVLYLLAPLYLVKSDVKMILIAQSFLVVSAGLPLYLLSKKKTKKVFFSFAVVFSYVFFYGTQWTVLNEFHQAAFIPFFLSFLFYSLSLKNKSLYYLSVLGLLGTKEEMGLLVGSIGFMLLFFKDNRKKGFFTLVLGIFSFFFLVYFLMPFISVHGTYRHLDFGEAGYTPMDVVIKSLKDPQFFFRSMVYPFVKVQTVFHTFLSFGFLPFLSPLYLIPIAEQFITRFIYSGPQFTKWINVNHHAAPLGILLAVASLESSMIIAKKIKHTFSIKTARVMIYIGIYLMAFTIFQDYYLKGPINSILKSQLYRSDNWIENNYQMLQYKEKLTPQIPVAAQNSLVPHLSQREEIYLLPEIESAEYIFLDLKDGPNKFSPLSFKEMIEFYENLLDSGNFKVEEKIGDAVILKRQDL